MLVKVDTAVAACPIGVYPIHQSTEAATVVTPLQRPITHLQKSLPLFKNFISHHRLRRIMSSRAAPSTYASLISSSPIGRCMPTLPVQRTRTRQVDTIQELISGFICKGRSSRRVGQHREMVSGADAQWSDRDRPFELSNNDLRRGDFHAYAILVHDFPFFFFLFLSPVDFFTSA